MPEKWTDWEKKVLRVFIHGERLLQIPAKWKKREVVLRWLITRFEANMDYPESEVNRILQQHHPDSATIRREFVVHGFMDREKSVYRRIPSSESSFAPCSQGSTDGELEGRRNPGL